MKQKLYIFLTAMLAILSFSACEHDIYIDPNEKDERLVMNGFIDADSTNNLIYLDMTGSKFASHVIDAQMEVHVNGVLKETVSNYNYTENANSKDSLIHTNRYYIHTKFKAGDKVRIDALTSDKKYHAYVEESIPYPLSEIQKVDTAHVVKKHYGDLMTKIWQFKISFSDRTNESNYYRLKVFNHIRTRVFNPYSSQWTITEEIVKFRSIYDDEPILMDGNVNNDNDMSDYLPALYNTENNYGVFSDKMFANKPCTLTIYDDLYFYEQPQDNVYYDISTLFSIESINKNEYYYLRALELYNSDNYSDDEDLTGPIKFPSNVKGGAGFVGFSISVSKMVLLQGLKQ